MNESLLKIKIKKLHKDAVIPMYATKGSAGFDIHTVNESCIKAGDTQIIKTGLSFEILEGYELQIRPRSGLSAKTKLRISNAPGTIDSDFRGEVGIIIDNIGKEDLVINKGDRIAQAVLCPVIQAEFEEVEELSSTERSEGGFGSTGN